MKKSLPAGIAAVMALMAGGCISGRSATREQRAALAARERDFYCDDEVEQATATVLREVQSVEPLYVSVRSGKSSYDARLLGARVWLRARLGMTPQWLERTLRCHQARNALQSNFAELTAPDPFSLPDRWIDIDVVPDRAGFIAVVRAETVADGKQIYARAQAIVATSTSGR